MWNQVKLMKQNQKQFIEDVELRVVEVFFMFSRIGEIDTMNEKFQAEVRIESRWIENESIDNYDPKKHWNPKLYIENALQLAKEDISYKVERDPDNYSNQTLVTEVRKVKGFFWERLELENFPLDLQELSVTLASSREASEVRLLSDKKRLSHINLNAKHMFTDQQKWKLFKIVKIKESASYDMGSSSTINELVKNMKRKSQENEDFSASINHASKISATCFSARRPGYYIFNAYFLIFLITSVALTIFSINPKLPQNRLQTNCTLLLTSVSFKWVINRYLPTVSYLTSLDKYAIVCITYLCFLSVWHSIIGSFWSAPDALIIDFWLLIVFVIVLIGLNLWTIIWFIMAFRQIKQLQAEEAIFVKNVESLKDKVVISL